MTTEITLYIYIIIKLIKVMFFNLNSSLGYSWNGCFTWFDSSNVFHPDHWLLILFIRIAWWDDFEHNSTNQNRTATKVTFFWVEYECRFLAAQMFKKIITFLIKIYAHNKNTNSIYFCLNFLSFSSIYSTQLTL